MGVKVTLEAMMMNDEIKFHSYVIAYKVEQPGFLNNQGCDILNSRTM